MLTIIHSAKCIGIKAVPVNVEVNISSGLGIHLVGLADTAVRESLLRTITALQSIGFRIPGKKIVINLAPADMHKKGSGYDLPIALGIIASSGQIELPNLEKYLIMGELGLDASVRDIPGALPIAELASENGYSGCILPAGSAMESKSPTTRSGSSPFSFSQAYPPSAAISRSPRSGAGRIFIRSPAPTI